MTSGQTLSPEYVRIIVMREAYKLATDPARFPVGSPEFEAADVQFRAACDAHMDALDAIIDRPVRTPADLIELARLTAEENWYADKLAPAVVKAVLQLAAKQ